MTITAFIKNLAIWLWQVYGYKVANLSLKSQTGKGYLSSNGQIVFFDV